MIRDNGQEDQSNNVEQTQGSKSLDEETATEGDSANPRGSVRSYQACWDKGTDPNGEEDGGGCGGSGVAERSRLGRGYTDPRLV